MTAALPAKPASEALILPLTPERWDDFTTLFGPNGACSGCWCTWWRLPGPDFSKMSTTEKKEYIRTVVQAGKEPGLIAYLESVPAGWVSVAPRTEFARLARSRKLAPVDDAPVWSINCFFIDRHYRRRGLNRLLIEAAIQFAASKGATLLEAYPIEVSGKASSSSLYYGVADTFRQCGFVEVARRSETQVIMRLKV